MSNSAFTANQIERLVCLSGLNAQLIRIGTEHDPSLKFLKITNDLTKSASDAQLTYEEGQFVQEGARLSEGVDWEDSEEECMFSRAANQDRKRKNDLSTNATAATTVDDDDVEEEDVKDLNEEAEEEEEEEDFYDDVESEDETNEIDLGRDWASMQVVLDREPQSEAMFELWKRDKQEWLVQSKRAWKNRHDELTQRRKKENPNYTSGFVSGDRTRRAEDLSFVNRSNRAMNYVQRGVFSVFTDVAPVQQVSAGSKHGPKIAVNMASLVKLGFLNAGPKKVFTVYLGNVYTGELTDEGEIICDCMTKKCNRNTYMSPSAWTIHCKRNVNPSKKGDDGWKSARYGNPEGHALEHFKVVYEAWRNNVKLDVSKQNGDENENEDDDGDDSLEKRQKDATIAEKACVNFLPEGTVYDGKVWNDNDDSKSNEDEAEEDDFEKKTTPKTLEKTKILPRRAASENIKKYVDAEAEELDDEEEEGDDKDDPDAMLID